MTIEQKLQAQTVLVDEITRRQQEQPTLLIDSLLYGQGVQFVHSMLHAAYSRHSSSAGLVGHLIKAIQGDTLRTAPEPPPAPLEQAWPRPPIEQGNGLWGPEVTGHATTEG